MLLCLRTVVYPHEEVADGGPDTGEMAVQRGLRAQSRDSGRPLVLIFLLRKLSPPNGFGTDDCRSVHQSPRGEGHRTKMYGK